MENKKLRKNIENLPIDVLKDIFAKVASSSIPDLLSQTHVCKTFKMVTEHEEVLKQVNFSEYPTMPWIPEDAYAENFMNKCLKAKNPECLFRDGMHVYFGLRGVAYGVEILEEAREAGHEVATFVLGLIKIHNGKPSDEEGIEMLNAFKNGRDTPWDVYATSFRATALLNAFSIKLRFPRTDYAIKCNIPNHTVERIMETRLDYRNVEDIERCNICCWYRQLFRFREY